MDVANTAIGVTNLGIMYAAVVKFKLSAVYVILVNLVTNLASFGLKEFLASSGNNKTNTQYELILYVVLVILTFAILLQRFNLLESLGIALVVSVATSLIVILGTMASVVQHVKTRLQ